MLRNIRKCTVAGPGAHRVSGDTNWPGCVVHGTYLSVPYHSNLCLSHPMGFPLHHYNINMEYNSIKIIKFMKV